MDSSQKEAIDRFHKKQHYRHISGGSIIKPVGMCTLVCQGNGKSSTVMFYVVHFTIQLIVGLVDCVT